MSTITVRSLDGRYSDEITLITRRMKYEDLANILEFHTVPFDKSKDCVVIDGKIYAGNDDIILRNDIEGDIVIVPQKPHFLSKYQKLYQKLYQKTI